MSIVGIIKNNAILQDELFKLFSQAITNNHFSKALEIHQCLKDKKKVQEIIQTKKTEILNDYIEDLQYNPEFEKAFKTLSECSADEKLDALSSWFQTNHSTRYMELCKFKQV